MENREILKKLESLKEISSLLDMSENERNTLVKTTLDYLNPLLENLETNKGFFEGDAQGLEVTGKPHSLKDILNLYQKQVMETGISAASGKHLGYIPGGGIFAAGLGDFMAAVTNVYAGVYYASPGAASIENEIIDWIKSIFSFPETAVGNLTSGGSISNLIGFTAARDYYKIKNEKVEKSVIYLSEQVHHSAQKALRIIGLEDAIIRYVPIDEYHRIQPEMLENLIMADISSGLIPFLVVASAGTTDTGAMDPLDKIADVTDKYNLWFHVDAAYGGFFILTSKKELFKGIERADSIIVDPHKGLFLPYGLGVVLVKDRDAILHSHHYSANYMQDGMKEEMILSPSHLSPELSKHFRGLRLWLPLQLHGVEPFVACLEEKLLLLQYFRNKIVELGFRIGPEPDLSISYFWYPFEENADEKNSRLMDEIHKDGDVFLSSSVIDGRFVIRIAILAFRTKKETIDRTLTMIERCLERV